MVICLVNEVNSFGKKIVLSSKSEFIYEFTRGYFEAEIIEKET